MAMTALERITFPCLKYLDKERKVGTCIKKRLNILFISPGSAASETNFLGGT